MSLFPSETKSKDKTTYSTHKQPIDTLVKSTLTKPFDDTDFPPNSKSLVGNRSPEDVKTNPFLAAMKDYSWVRILELADKKPEVFIGGVSPNDIIQGKLADCDLLSSIAAVSEFPERIERLFNTKTFNQHGRYSISLCITGVWREVIIDDFLPVLTSTGQLAFAMSKGFELWVSLLEKAFAKAFGAYGHISDIQAQISSTLVHLTGAPSFDLLHSDYSNMEDLRQSLIESDKLKYIIVGNVTENANLKGSGIQENSTYSVLSINQIQNGKTTVLKLRNPWGSGEWTGDWSDKSPLWTSELKKELGMTSEDDGTFFMDWKDYLKYFNFTSVCHYREDYVSSSYNLDLPDETDCFLQFDIKKEGGYYFGIHQADSKHFPGVGYKTGFISFVVGRQEADKKWKYVSSGMVDLEAVYKFSSDCKPGKYFVILYTNWDSASDDFTFTIYGPEAVQISEVQNKDNRAKAMEYLFETLKSYALDIDSKELAIYGSILAFKLSSVANYYIYVFKNCEELDFQIKFPNLTYDVYLYPKPKDQKGKSMGNISLKPKEMKYLVYRTSNHVGSDKVSFDIDL